MFGVLPRGGVSHLVRLTRAKGLILRWKERVEMRGKGRCDYRTVNQEHSEDIPPREAFLISYK